MDAIGSWVTEAVQAVLGFLPDSPFAMLQNYQNSEFGEWLGYLNWFIPINTFVSILTTWVTAIAIYYVYQIVLRWIKAIE